jgi:hypothetical protein
MQHCHCYASKTEYKDFIMRNYELVTTNNSLRMAPFPFLWLYWLRMKPNCFYKHCINLHYHLHPGPLTSKFSETKQITDFKHIVSWRLCTNAEALLLIQ